MTIPKYVDWVLAVVMTLMAGVLLFATGFGVMLAFGGATINW